MTFLQLVQRLHQEAGIAGLPPQSVTNQIGMASKLVSWAAEAWIDIQSLYTHWKFLRKRDVKTLSVGKSQYAMVADLSMPNVRKWNAKLIFVRDPDTNVRSPLQYREYEEFEYMYPQIGTGLPSCFTVDPDYNICFDTTPDKKYLVEFNYWMTGERLAVEGDIPSLPEDHHLTIVWLALQRYGSHEGARDVLADANRNYGTALRRLEIDQLPLPEHVRGKPLA